MYGSERADSAAFLATLISKPVASRLSRLEDYFRAEPYTAPFERASETLSGNVCARHGAMFAESAAPAIHAALAKAFVARARQTGRYALHVAYVRSGLSYRDWCDKFHASAPRNHPWQTIAEEFPALIALLAELGCQFEAAVAEVLQRLAADRVAIEARFGIPRSAPLTAITPDLSDPHRGGRTVVRLAFGSQTLIYKPKPVQIEAAFNRFVAECDLELGLRSLPVLARPGYGWVADAGTHDSNVPLNPESIGRAAACFWLINATDLHFENVLPRADGLVALDLETLLAAPVIMRAAHDAPSWREHSINATLLFDAGLGIHRLAPSLTGLDLSAGALPPVPDVRFELRDGHIEMRALQPSPRRAAAFPVAPSPDQDIAQRIVSAFRAAALGPMRRCLESFVSTLDGECTLRLVLRDTLFYYRLLERMRQPRHLRSWDDLVRDLRSLHGGVRDPASKAALDAIVQDEIRQLLRGDIPYFCYQADRRALQLSDTRIPDFFASTGKAEALAKLQDAEECDVDEQCALLSIALGIPPPEIRAGRPRTGSRDRELAGSMAVIARELDTLARRIAAAAFRPAHRPARWLSFFGEVTSQDLKIGAGDTAFFGGAWGILLALQAVESALAPHQRCEELREFLDEQAGHWSRLFSATDRSRNGDDAPLGFAGRGGDIFAQATLLWLDARRWEFLPTIVDQNLRTLEEHITRDELLDVIGGAAGLALGCSHLLSLEFSGLFSPHTKQAACDVLHDCATHLMNTAQACDEALAWRVPGEQVPLLSYAHGWAGIVTALTATARHADASNKPIIEECVRKAAAYPARLLRVHGSWWDHRSGLAERTPMNRSWCNGIPGFLRGMYAVGQNEWSADTRSEIETLVTATERTLGSGAAYRFCCGEMGNVDLLLDGPRLWDRTDRHRDEQQTQLARVVAQILTHANDAPPDVPELVFPGLFQGQSGLAYSAARLLMPQLPSLSGQALP